MAEYYTHVPRELALQLRDKYNARIFVETGTYKGQTALWANEHFDRVYTIELSPRLFKEFNDVRASLNLDQDKIISCFGDSRVTLRSNDIDAFISTRNCFFWLDAHWFHLDDVAGEREDVPLMEELQIILATGMPHVILIDDAPLISKEMRERDENYKKWPTWSDIELLFKGRYTAYYTGNVLVLEPKEKI